MAADELAVVATWRGGCVHVWVWDGASWVPPFMAERFRELRRHLPPPGVGQVSSVDVRATSGAALRPMSIRLDPLRAPEWLAGIDAGTSDSLRWFAAAAREAASVADAGLLSPVLDRVDSADGASLVHARWVPLPCKQLDAAVQTLDVARPAITSFDGGVGAASVIGAFVDGLARSRLAARLWTADIPRDRSVATAMTKATVRALAGADHRVAAPPAKTDVLADIGRRLDRRVRRAAGVPVVLPRVRLDVPEDPLDPWVVSLELVDEADPGRWCSAADVWDETPLAVEVAAGPEHLPGLAAALRDAARAIAAALPVASELVAGERPASIELDVDDAAEFLDQAPAALEREGITIIGPELLVRAAVGVRGTATPAPASDRKLGFNRDSIVAWTLVVHESDGPVAITAAELARAEASGSALLHTGHRWVRIDPAALRRARQRLDDYVARTNEEAEALGGLELLRLAADAAAAGDDLGPGDIDGPDAPGRSASWTGRLLGGLPDDELREEQESPTFTGELRHYQRRALSWLRFLARVGLGGCLADDMGLGKTATALAHLVDRPGPHLVVCPLSVVHNWETEAARFTPSLPVTVHHGAGRHGDDAGDLGAAGLVVTTYGLLARDIERLASVPWTTVVLDEAQFVKNPATKAARAARLLAADQRLALTGTPVENRLAELWSILDGVNPGMLGSRESFRHRFAKPIERGDDRSEHAAAELRKLTRPFVLRRTKADRRLVPDLPDKIEQVAYAGLTREQATLYQHVVDQLLADAAKEKGMKRRGLILASINKLKQICNHPVHALGDGGRLGGRSGKLDRFDELVDDLVDVGERALVFTQYVEMGRLLQRHLAERRGVTVPFLHGGVGRGRRTAMIDRFQDLGRDHPPVLLVSLKAGGTGLNLTAATQVIHYDRWWNPAVENQATDRAWRIGQQHTVLVHKLVCTGTIEERIDQLITDKQALADLVVGSGEQWLSELSTNELRDLVRLDRDAALGAEG